MRYRVGTRYHRMPMLPGFVLIALSIWLAGNVGTFSHAWRHPGQRDGWTMVSTGQARLVVQADARERRNRDAREPAARVARRRGARRRARAAVECRFSISSAPPRPVRARGASPKRDDPH
ncbi:DUF817 family protein [Burkholderia plantarii]|nr:DUF817 family protein [Burkholderia plantarii]